MLKTKDVLNHSLKLRVCTSSPINLTTEKGIVYNQCKQCKESVPHLHLVVIKTPVKEKVSIVEMIGREVLERKKYYDYVKDGGFSSGFPDKERYFNIDTIIATAHKKHKDQDAEYAIDKVFCYSVFDIREELDFIVA